MDESLGELMKAEEEGIPRFKDFHAFFLRELKPGSPRFKMLCASIGGALVSYISGSMMIRCFSPLGPVVYPIGILLAAIWVPLPTIISLLRIARTWNLRTTRWEHLMAMALWLSNNFAFSYQMLSELNSKAFNQAFPPLRWLDILGWLDRRFGFLYYSLLNFFNFDRAGWTPQSWGARLISLEESLLGLFYFAVVVAILVGRMGSDNGSNSEASGP